MMSGVVSWDADMVGKSSGKPCMWWVADVVEGKTVSEGRM